MKSIVVYCKIVNGRCPFNFDSPSDISKGVFCKAPKDISTDDVSKVEKEGNLPHLCLSRQV